MTNHTVAEFDSGCSWSMAAHGKTERLTERKLVNGWASGAGFWVRQATAADLPPYASW